MSPEPAVLIGVDAGLTTIQTVAVGTDGTVHAEASEPTPEQRPSPGFREVTPDQLWQRTTTCITEVTEQLDPAAIAAVGVAGHGHGMYAIDAGGDGIDPAIKSTDSRATGLVEEWKSDGTAASIEAALGFQPFAGDPISLLGWLQRNKPAFLDRIEHVCFCKDYLKYRLTDVVCTDEMEGSVFDLPEGCGAKRALSAAGVDECVATLPDVVPSWQRCGHLTEPAAEDTGIPEGTPVASGLHDVGATALGVGAHRPGDGLFIVGTWGQSIAILDDSPTDGPGLTRRFLSDTWLRYQGNRSATASRDWFVDVVGDPWHAEAERLGQDPYAIYDERIGAVTPGADGVIFLPYLDGSTADPGDRGAFLGLSTEHDPDTLLRAVYEGIAMAQVVGFNAIREDDQHGSLYLAGGGANSRVWSQLFADVLGQRLSVPGDDVVGARGAAICAARAAGLYASHAEAVTAMVRIDREHVPADDAADWYRDRLGTFVAALEAVRPTWHRIKDEPTGAIN